MHDWIHTQYVAAVLDWIGSPGTLGQDRKPTCVIRYMWSQEERHLHPKWRALTHIHAGEEASHSSWSPQTLDKEYFQQGSWKQNLFAFLHSTFSFLRSFVSVGIFPYFILFLLSPGERDFHWNSCSQGPEPMQGQKDNRATYLPSSFIYLFFFLPSPLCTPLALDWWWSMQDDSCLLCISIANEIEEEKKKKKWSFRECVWVCVCAEPQACRAGKRADQHPDRVLPGYSSWQRGDMGTALVSSAALTKTYL